MKSCSYSRGLSLRHATRRTENCSRSRPYCASASAGRLCVMDHYEDIRSGNLKGHVVVQWDGEGRFIYLKQSNPLSFQPSFISTPIVPDNMSPQFHHGQSQQTVPVP